MVDKNAIIITSVASMVDQFLMPSINILMDMGYSITICCNFESGNNCENRNIKDLKYTLNKRGIKLVQVNFARNVFSLRQHMKAFKQVKLQLRKKTYQIIHCHSPVGGLLTRLAVKRSMEQKVIYTAHGFHFYKGAPLINWLLYYPIEIICSFKTDILVTVNTEDYSIAKQKMKAKEVVYIPGVGVSVKSENSELTMNTLKLFRNQWGLKDSDKFLLSVGELNKNKNHASVIRALAVMKENRPEIEWHYFICGKGALAAKLKKLIKKLKLEKYVHLVGFSDEIGIYLACADLFIHPSLREGLSVALMEAIASNVPVICSDIRGNRDLVMKRARFNPVDLEDIESKISLYLEKRDTKDDLIWNRKKIEKCSIENVSILLRKLYA